MYTTKKHEIVTEKQVRRCPNCEKRALMESPTKFAKYQCTECGLFTNNPD